MPTNYNNKQRKVILYISMSLDGFIATKEDDLSWLSVVEQEGEDYGYGALSQSVDTYIVGRKTYEVVLGLTGGIFPQAQQYDCYVITTQDRPSVDGITFYNGSISTLIQSLKKEEGKHIYCDGGGQIVQLLMQEDLIDEYCISIIPILLGDGILLFRGNTPSFPLKALSSKQYESGLIQVKYERSRE